MSFLASLMCPREMEGGLSPFHKTEIVFRGSAGSHEICYRRAPTLPRALASSLPGLGSQKLGL